MATGIAAVLGGLSVQACQDQCDAALAAGGACNAFAVHNGATTDSVTNNCYFKQHASLSTIEAASYTGWQCSTPYSYYWHSGSHPSSPPLDSPSSGCTSTPSAVCTSNPEELCIKDSTCDDPGGGVGGGLGCGAGGSKFCRFCGFANYPDCSITSGLTPSKQGNATMELIGGAVAAVVLLALLLFASRHERPCAPTHTAATAEAAPGSEQALDAGLRACRLRESRWIDRGGSSHQRPSCRPSSKICRVVRQRLVRRGAA